MSNLKYTLNPLTTLALNAIGHFVNKSFGDDFVITPKEKHLAVGRIMSHP